MCRRSHGALLLPVPRESLPPVPPQYTIANQEAAVLAGVRSLMDTFAAERKHVVKRDHRTRVVLTYGI